MNVITKEIIVDENLLYLEKILFGLNDYSFDRDITNQINLLKQMIYDRLYSQLEKEHKDIKDYNFIFRYELEKKS